MNQLLPPFHTLLKQKSVQYASLWRYSSISSLNLLPQLSCNPSNKTELNFPMTMEDASLLHAVVTRATRFDTAARRARSDSSSEAVY